MLNVDNSYLLAAALSISIKSSGLPIFTSALSPSIPSIGRLFISAFTLAVSVTSVSILSPRISRLMGLPVGGPSAFLSTNILTPA